MAATTALCLGVRFNSLEVRIAVEAAAFDAYEAFTNGDTNGIWAIQMGDLVADTPVAVRQNFFLAELLRRGIAGVAVAVPGVPVVNPAVGGPAGFISPRFPGNFVFYI